MVATADADAAVVITIPVLVLFEALPRRRQQINASKDNADADCEHARLHVCEGSKLLEHNAAAQNGE
jgi:hypothetical protein